MLQIDKQEQKEIHVFIGPSIPDGYKHNPNFVYHPPIRRNDLNKLLNLSRNPGIFLLVDGVFHNNLSVSITEIRQSIDLGWEVWGCSSMGALRAVECSSIGMKGYGVVYRWLRLFEIEDDDEVAQIFFHEDYSHLSEPMIDLRYILSKLKKTIGLDLSLKILKELKSLYYPKRTIDKLLGMIPGVHQEQIRAEISRIGSLKTIDYLATRAKLSRTR